MRNEIDANSADLVYLPHRDAKMATQVVRPSIERQAGLSAWLVAATAIFGWVVHRHYPLGDWLFFRYATYLCVPALLFLTTSLVGLSIVERVARPRLPMAERLVLALPVGILLFTVCLTLLGLVGRLDAFTFVALPAVFLLAGAYGSRGTLRRLHRHRGALVALLRAGPGAGLLAAAGAIGLLLMYAPILTPENISFDTRWYHMAIGETYAVTGRISRSPEGWLLGAMPQLATMLFAWCFLMPGTLLFDRVELCAHLEFVLFVATLPGIVVATRRVLPRALPGTGAAWVFLFFFPGIFLYDSNLGAGADHIAALFAAPLFLTFLRAAPALAPRPLSLFALVAVGVMHVKYTAFQLLVFPALALAARFLWLLVRRARARTLDRAFFVGPSLAVALVAALWAPHWLKNLIWYSNPVFPMAGKAFHSTPWVANTPARLTVLFSGSDWKPPRNFSGFLRTLRAILDFSFIPNDWDAFHRDVPVFGSLFTLVTPCVPFLRRTRRLWALFGMSVFAIPFWYWTAHQDRYLQATLPLMAAATAATLMSVWDLGLLPRLGAALLVGLQVVWGGDVPFLPTHTMMNESPFTASVEFVSRGFRGKRDDRFEVFRHWQAMRDALPPGARVLLHDELMHLGIGAPVVSDMFQSGLDYAQRPRPDQLYDTFKELGVTHFIAPTGDSRATDSFGADLAWHYFIKRYAVRPKKYGGFTLSRMPTERPDASGFKDRALVLGCAGSYASGLYAFEDLHVPVRLGTSVRLPPFPAPRLPVAERSAVAPLLAEVDAVIHAPDCFDLGEVSLEDAGFLKATKREQYLIWVRRP